MVKLGQLWTGNHEPINFGKMPKFIQLIEMVQIIFKKK